VMGVMQMDEYEAFLRARVLEGFNKLIADLQAGRKIDPDKATREVFDHTKPPVVSDRLRATLTPAANAPRTLEDVEECMR
jgi:hypothetical protein